MPKLQGEVSRPEHDIICWLPPSTSQSPLPDTGEDKETTPADPLVFELLGNAAAWDLTYYTTAVNQKPLILRIISVITIVTEYHKIL